MGNANLLYLLIIVFFAASFFGLVLLDGLWIFYATLAVAVVLFLLRIARGDD